MYHKPQRLKSKEALKIFKLMSCIVCGQRPVDPHHVLSRGSGKAEFVENNGKLVMNLMPVCRPHHIEWHQIGAETFLKKYDKANHYLTQIGHPSAIKKAE